MKTTVITYGTFDMFHIGHLKLLQNLATLGDTLIVAVSSDEFNELKGKSTIIPYEQRAEIVKNIKFVDEVIAENAWEQKISDIQKYQVDIFAIGDDWRGKFDYLQEYCQVIYLPRTKDVSTDRLKATLANFLSISKKEMLHALKVLEILKKDFD